MIDFFFWLIVTGYWLPVNCLLLLVQRYVCHSEWSKAEWRIYFKTSSEISE